VDYYYWDCEEIESILCQITVIDEYEHVVSDAHCLVRRLNNQTQEYVNVSNEITDGNGQFTIWLIPYVNYRFEVSKEGMIQTGSKFWIPSPLEYTKTFRLEYLPGYDETIWDNLIWSIEPDYFDHYNNFTMWFNITSSDNQLEWFAATVYFYNTTSEVWDVIYSQNLTTVGGGSISHTTANGTGRYGLNCRFKKQDYDEYYFGTPHNPDVYVFTLWPPGLSPGNLDDLMDNIMGKSPVHVGATVVAWSALGAAFASIFLFFQLSPKFAGMGIIIVGLVLGFLKNPLGLISDDVMTFTVVSIIVILGVITFIVAKKGE